MQTLGVGARIYSEPLVNIFDEYSELLYSLCLDVNSPFSLRVAILLRNCAYAELMSLEINPNDYSNSLDYLKDAQVLAFVEKHSMWPVYSKVDRQRQCIKKFIAAEYRNREVNTRLFSKTPYEENARQVLNLAKSIVWEILGENPPTISSLNVEFGKGSCFGLSRKHADPYSKLQTLEVTSSALSHARELLTSNQSWSDAINLSETEIRLVKGNRFFTVPKNSKTDRPCAQEPNLNGTMQKMYGTVIRERLQASYGILHKNAQDHHGRMARYASLSGRLATVDAKNASGSITYACVNELTPPKWMNLLDDLRSKAYTYDDQSWIDYQQFSSMGNGFTFELETVIFYAVARAACLLTGSDCSLRSLSTYGDDVIIPTKALETFLCGFNALGFEVNNEKSFSTGPFRESCGYDWFNGDSVRPVFIRGELSLRTLYTVHNQLVVNGYNHIYPSLMKAILNIVKKFGIPNFGPFNGSDGHLVDLHWPYGVPFTTFTQDQRYAPVEPGMLKQYKQLHRRLMKVKRDLRTERYKTKRAKTLSRASMKLEKLKVTLESSVEKFKRTKWFWGNDYLLPFALLRLAPVADELFDHHWSSRYIHKNFMVGRNARLFRYPPDQFLGRGYDNDNKRYRKTKSVIN